MRRLALLLPLPLIAACAQVPPAPDATAWIGRSEGELVSALGVPSRVWEAEGRRVLAYDGHGAPTAAPMVVPSIGFGVGRSTGGWGRSTGVGIGTGLTFGGFGGGVAQPCSTNYEIRDGRVIGAISQPPGCS